MLHSGERNADEWLNSSRHADMVMCVAGGVSEDMPTIILSFAQQLLGSFHWCSLTMDLLALQLPPALSQTAWHVLLLLVAQVDNLQFLSGGWTYAQPSCMLWPCLA